MCCPKTSPMWCRMFCATVLCCLTKPWLKACRPTTSCNASCSKFLRRIRFWIRMSESPQTPEAILRRLEYTAVRRLDGLLQGDYRTLFRGQGLDLADLREYQHHDDVRYIDWNVTARLQV